MKKWMAVLLCVVLLMNAVPALAISWDTFTMGMTREQAYRILTELDMKISADDIALYAYASDRTTVYLAIDSSGDLVNWVNLTVPGSFLINDFAVPDWQMTVPELMKLLEENHVAYDLFIDAEGTQVCFDGCMFNIGTLVWAYFDRETLDSVEVSLLGQDSVLPWAASMGAVLGAPHEESDLEITTNGEVYDLDSGLCWYDVNGCDYVLRHQESVLALVRNSSVKQVGETRINIIITPSGY